MPERVEHPDKRVVIVETFLTKCSALPNPACTFQRTRLFDPLTNLVFVAAVVIAIDPLLQA